MLGQKKYTLGYMPNTFEIGWNKDFDSIEEFDFFVEDLRENAGLLIFDNEAGKIIFWKRCSDQDPVVNLI